MVGDRLELQRDVGSAEGSEVIADKLTYEALRQGLVMEGFFDDVTALPHSVLSEMQRRGWLQGYALTPSGARAAALAARRVALLLDPSRLEIVQ